MAQFARPSADTNNPDSYTDQAGGSTSIFQTIDESAASDTDYIRTVVSPTNDVYVTKLSSITDPGLSTGHVLRWRYACDQNGQESLDFTAQLRQGYVSEASQGTLIVARTFTGIATATFAQDSYTLAGAEADAITNYADLYIRFLINKP